uniref:NADH-ubiquinone oxidoreductase chain 5 n=1 Tax=Tullbergia mixta TaxID=1499077 RepID=A0A7T6Y6Z5_9HEXA|nr:NADH dehydrogenase subunit 5 [Tullbergia mixta]QQK54725.1 NADH dehydrogenase subunit 5 [Tullbergia mixta]
MAFVLVSSYLGCLMLFLGGSMVFLSGVMGLLGSAIFVEWDMFGAYSFSFVFTILLDWISLSFTGVVLIISGGVMVYSSEYMGGDIGFYSFIILVGLFVLSMLFMILSPNMISILLGWDGLGLVSYCLVIYYQNASSANAGMLTILSNRIGDIAILLSIAWLFNYGGWNFLFFQMMFKNEVGWVMGLVILAALTKSAQIPFSAWLPAAMAAPTPVSALVHSSTLVTAGVYLLVRFSELLGVNYVLFFLSVLTMFMSGLGANFEMDLKSIIALSTLSQLGVMMMALSLGLVELAYFHLLTHALFKSLLFLCAGVCIHGSLDIQDIRMLGGMSLSAPLTSFFFLGSSLALCGFPFLSGFYSSDLILEAVFGGAVNGLMVVLVVLATFFTITYSIRLFMFVVEKPLAGASVKTGMESWVMAFPMGLLFSLAVVSGSLLGWWFIPPLVYVLPEAMKVLILAFMSLAVGVGVLSLGVLNWLGGLNMFIVVSVVHYMGSMWWLSLMSSNSWGLVLSLGAKFLKYFDQGWLESLGPQGIYFKMSSFSVAVDFFSYVTAKKFIYMFLVMFLTVTVLLW